MIEYHYVILWGFPGGSLVKNLPANAGDMGSTPDSVKSHMPWSNRVCNCNYWVHATATKPTHSRSHALQQKAMQWAALAQPLESSLCLLQLQKSLCRNEGPAQPKINKYNYFKGVNSVCFLHQQKFLIIEEEKLSPLENG